MHDSGITGSQGDLSLWNTSHAVCENAFMLLGRTFPKEWGNAHSDKQSSSDPLKPVSYKILRKIHADQCNF